MQTKIGRIAREINLYNAVVCVLGLLAPLAVVVCVLGLLAYAFVLACVRAVAPGRKATVPTVPTVPPTVATVQPIKVDGRTRIIPIADDKSKRVVVCGRAVRRPTVNLDAPLVIRTQPAPRTVREVTMQELVAKCRALGVKGVNARWKRQTLLAAFVRHGAKQTV